MGNGYRRVRRREDEIIRNWIPFNQRRSADVYGGGGYAIWGIGVDLSSVSTCERWIRTVWGRVDCDVRSCGVCEGVWGGGVIFITQNYNAILGFYLFLNYNLKMVK